MSRREILRLTAYPGPTPQLMCGPTGFSHHGKRHPDGWGLAFYDGRAAIVCKEAKSLDLSVLSDIALEDHVLGRMDEGGKKRWRSPPPPTAGPKASGPCHVAPTR